VPTGILAMLLGCAMVYAALFGTGAWIYGQTGLAAALTATAIGAGLVLTRVWRRLTER
jgi:hypothetical protein